MFENNISKDDLDEYLYVIYNLFGEENKIIFFLLFFLILEEEVFNEVIGIEKLINIVMYNDVFL